MAEITIVTSGLPPYTFSKRPVDIVREYFPGVSNEEADGILWEFTGWPCFWEGAPEESMREQLAELKAEQPEGGAIVTDWAIRQLNVGN